LGKLVVRVGTVSDGPFQERLLPDDEKHLQ
jgi:hypothetical protein